MIQPLHWYHRGFLALAWLPVSWAYYALVRLRTALIRAKTLEVPVICVGNNTVGGSGKTPVTIALCAWLTQHGYHPHIISRGYKGQYIGVVRVNPEIHIAQEVGDEPLLLANHAPCWVAKRRIMAARAAIRDGADVIVMDDGLQNPTLHKTFSVVVFDALAGIGNGWMLPAGPCREPFGRTMRKADVALVIGAPIDARLKQRLSRSSVPKFNAAFMPDDSIHLHGKRVHPFAGIGNPDKFFATIEAMGASITLSSRFPDHHYYSHADLERLQREAQQHDALLVTTQKDAVKLPADFLHNVLVLPVTLEIEQSDAFYDLLTHHLARAVREDA